MGMERLSRAPAIVEPGELRCAANTPPSAFGTRGADTERRRQFGISRSDTDEKGFCGA